MIKTVSKEVFKNTTGVSYSRLSKLAESPQAYQASLAEDPDSSAISIGSAVDIKLTQPEVFDEEIYVMTADKPSAPMMLKFAESLAFTGDKLTAHAESGFKIGVEAVMKKFENEGKDYVDALNAAKGRKILDAEDLFKVNQIVSTLKSNPFTKKYFTPEDGVDLIFQPYILWDMMYYSLMEEGKSTVIKAKSVLDVVRIDHRNKVVEPMELKTGAEGFMKAYWRYKRYLQGAMYHTATHVAMRPEDLDLYDIENIKFVFADSNLRYPPRIYRMSDDDIAIGTHGKQYRTLAGRGNPTMGYLDDNWKVKGYAQLAAELEWHQKNDQWDYSYDVYQRDGEVDIDAFTFKF